MYLSATNYGGIRSALTHMDRVSRKDMNQLFKKEIYHFMSVMKRLISSNKKQDGISLEEWNKVMNFDVYKTLCDVIHQVEGEDFLFSNSFLTMECNFMERSENCVNMHITHIQWRWECLIFNFWTLKGNQVGERYSDPRRVYSNPKNPTICTVLDLAKYIFSNPDILTRNSPLFPGNFQYDKFLNIFHKSIKDNFDHFQALGNEKVIIGAHLLEKELLP